MLNSLWLVAKALAVLLSLGAAIGGIVAHFWILARLEASGYQVKYFATASDNWRAYLLFRRVAKEEHWPQWPFYVALVGSYCGMLGLFATLLINHSFFESLLRNIQK